MTTDSANQAAASGISFATAARARPQIAIAFALAGRAIGNERKRKGHES